MDPKSLPFSEWTREQKDRYARQKMDEMKLKNERYKERYAEVEKDRLKAEERNSSITSAKVVQKPENVKAPAPSNVKSEREWDRNKANQDEEDEFLDWRRDNRGSRGGFRGSRHGFNDRKYENKGDWRNRPPNRNQSSNSYSRYDAGNPNNENKRGPRKHFEGESYQKTRSDYNKNISDNHSNHSDSEIEKVDKGDSEGLMWHDGNVNETRNKQNRVAKWVSSINRAYDDRKPPGVRDRTRRYGDDATSRKPARDNYRFKNESSSASSNIRDAERPSNFGRREQRDMPKNYSNRNRQQFTSNKYASNSDINESQRNRGKFTGSKAVDNTGFEDTNEWKKNRYCPRAGHYPKDSTSETQYSRNYEDEDYSQNTSQNLDWTVECSKSDRKSEIYDDDPSGIWGDVEETKGEVYAENSDHSNASENKSYEVNAECSNFSEVDYGSVPTTVICNRNIGLASEGMLYSDASFYNADNIRHGEEDTNVRNSNSESGLISSIKRLSFDDKERKN